jgi:hypothetical protein
MKYLIKFDSSEWWADEKTLHSLIVRALNRGAGSTITVEVR